MANKLMPRRMLDQWFFRGIVIGLAPLNENMASTKLSERQKRFVDEYLKNPSATQAYIAAVYSEKGAGPSAYQLLKVPHVAAEVARRQAVFQKKNELTAERIMQELGDIAFLDPGTTCDEQGKLLPINKMPEATRRAIAGIKQNKNFTKLRMSSKSSALELAANIVGLTKAQEQNNAVQIVVRGLMRQCNGKVSPSKALVKGLAKELDIDESYLNRLAEEVRKDLG
jgi:phage terminase small subunit